MPLSVGTTLITSLTVYADGINPGLFPVNSSPYGRSTLDWTMEWWKWLIGVPADKNPMKDLTGINCAQNQNDPNVWFITGNEGGATERTCTIPHGKAIFFGHGYECSTSEYQNLKNYEQLNKCAIESKDLLINWKYRASLDGVELRNLTSYEKISPQFKIDYPSNPVWGIEGTSPAAADTYFIFMEPLSEGKHVFEVQSSGDIVNPDTNQAQNQAMQVKYNLIIKK